MPRLVAMMFVSFMLLGVTETWGQAYPNKPIHLVTGGAGGGLDFVARLLSPGLSTSLGQPVVVDNKPSGVIPGDTVAKAPPDGYTLLVNGSSFWIGSLLQKLPYDPIKDFTPVSLLARQPLILYMSPTVPAKTVKELIAYAKSKPGELNNSIGGVTGTTNLAGELFKSMAGVKITAVPYSSDALQLTDLLSGRVQMTINSPASLMEQVKAGKLKALAVTSAEPSSLVPDLPPIAATLPGYEVVQLIAMFAPAKTPDAVINRLNHDVNRFLQTSEAKDKLLTSGVEADATTPEQAATTIKADLARMSKVVKDAGIKIE